MVKGTLLLLLSALLAGCSTQHKTNDAQDKNCWGSTVDNVPSHCRMIESEGFRSYVMTPYYPKYGLEREVDGYAIVNFQLNEAGIPKNIKVVESHPGQVFDQIAVKTVQSWKYEYTNTEVERAESFNQTLDFDYRKD